MPFGQGGKPKAKLTARKGKQHGATSAKAPERKAEPSTKAKVVHVVRDGEWVQEAGQPRQTRASGRLQPAPRATTPPPRQTQPGAQPRAAGAKKTRSPVAAAAASKESSPPAVQAAKRPRILDVAIKPRAMATSSAANAAVAIAGAADDAMEVEEQLASLNCGVQTRRTAEAAEAAMRDARERLEQLVRDRKERMRDKTEELLDILRSPLDAWGEDAAWQLAMCEYALDAPSELSGRQMGMGFRARAAQARHHEEIPRLRGLYEIDVLRAVLLGSERLCRELHRQLDRFKRLCCRTLSGFGRFRTVSVEPGESLLDLWQRTHEEARKWRPPGNPGKAAVGVEPSKVKGMYTAERVTDTLDGLHTVTGKTLSLRGTASMARWATRRHLKSIKEEDRPHDESYGTIRLRDIQALKIQRTKANEHTFSRSTNVVQWDEATELKVPWCVTVLNAMRPSDGMREREVIATTKVHSQG